MTDTQPPITDPKAARAEVKAAKARAKALRPWYKKKRFILLIIVALIVVASIAGGKKSTKTTTTASTSTTCTGKTYPDQQKSDVCANASNSVVVGNMTVTATPFMSKTDDIGGKALCSSVSITNNATKSQDYNVLDFKVQTPSGVVSSTSVLSLSGTLDSGTLIAGANKTGLVCTDDKGEKGHYVFIYKPNAFSSSRGTWLFNVE